MNRPVGRPVNIDQIIFERSQVLAKTPTEVLVRSSRLLSRAIEPMNQEHMPTARLEDVTCDRWLTSHVSAFALGAKVQGVLPLHINPWSKHGRSERDSCGILFGLSAPQQRSTRLP